MCAAGCRWVLGAGVLVIILPGQAAQAATIRFTPSASVNETYTDNVRSVTQGAEADFITQSNVGGQLTADGNSLNLNLNAGAAYDLYHNTRGLDGFRPKILGKGDAELLQDRLFVDGFVSMSEVTASRQGAISATTRSLPSNKRQLTTYSLEPRLEHRFGRTASATLSYLYSETLVSQPSAGAGVTPGSPGSSAGDTKSEKANLKIGTGPKFGRLDSQFLLSSYTSKRSGAGPRPRNLTRDKAELVNEYQLVRQLALIVRGGYEETADANRNLSSSGATGAIGFRFKPGPKLDVRLERGRRFKNNNTNFEMTYKISPFYTLNSSFSQSVTNQAEARLDDARNLVTDPITGDIIDPLTGNVIDPNESDFTADGGSFQQDRARLGFIAKRGRNSLNLDAAFTSRDPKTGGVSEDQVNFNMNYNSAMRRDLSGSLGFRYNDVTRSGTAGSGQTTYRSTAGLSYALGRIINTSLQYHRLLRTSENRDDLSEDAVVVGVNANF